MKNTTASRLLISRKIRASGYTQQQISERTGINQGNLSKFISGKKRLGKEKIQKLCLFLDIKENYKIPAELEHAILEALDGKDERAKKLTRIVRYISGLGRD